MIRYNPPAGGGSSTDQTARDAASAAQSTATGAASAASTAQDRADDAYALASAGDGWTKQTTTVTWTSTSAPVYLYMPTEIPLTGTGIYHVEMLFGFSDPAQAATKKGGFWGTYEFVFFVLPNGSVQATSSALSVIAPYSQDRYGTTIPGTNAAYIRLEPNTGNTAMRIRIANFAANDASLINHALSCWSRHRAVKT